MRGEKASVILVCKDNEFRWVCLSIITAFADEHLDWTFQPRGWNPGRCQSLEIGHQLWRVPLVPQNDVAVSGGVPIVEGSKATWDLERSRERRPLKGRAIVSDEQSYVEPWEWEAVSFHRNRDPVELSSGQAIAFEARPGRIFHARLPARR